VVTITDPPPAARRSLGVDPDRGGV